MVIREIKGDLFTAPSEYYLAHCISGDFALGAGIAKQFVKNFDMRNELFELYGDIRGEESVGRALKVGKVFNLVTKNRCYEKPTYSSLRETLEDMKDQCRGEGIKKLAMPHIASGLDKLDWEIVKSLIEEVFEKTDIEIVIYDFDK